MGFYSAHGGHSTVFRALIILAAAVSALFSILQIVLIKHMKLYNGHILLILSMAIAQLVYDLSFYPGVIDVGITWIIVLANVMQLIGGIAVAGYSNVMATVVLVVIHRKRSYDIIGNFKYYNLGIAVIVFVMVLLYLMSVGNPAYGYLADIALLDLYYYARLASIFYNFVACSIAYYYVTKMTSGHNRGRSIQEDAIVQLATRMQFYPLVQAISRFGCAWYEFQYGWNFDPPSVNPTQFAAQLCLAILTPAASIGYFVLFLKMQPHAYATFMSYLLCRPITAVGSLKSPFSKTTSNPVHNSNTTSKSFPDSSAPPVTETYVNRTSVQFSVSPVMMNGDEDEDEDEENDQDGEVRASTTRLSQFEVNVMRYSRGNLNIKDVSDEELFEIIDSYAPGNNVARLSTIQRQSTQHRESEMTGFHSSTTSANSSIDSKSNA